MDLSKQGNFSSVEMIPFIAPDLINESGLVIFLTTMPTFVFFPKGTTTLVPFFMLVADL